MLSMGLEDDEMTKFLFMIHILFFRSLIHLGGNGGGFDSRIKKGVLFTGVLALTFLRKGIGRQLVIV